MRSPRNPRIPYPRPARHWEKMDEPIDTQHSEASAWKIGMDGQGVPPIETPFQHSTPSDIAATRAENIGSHRLWIMIKGDTKDGDVEPFSDSQFKLCTTCDKYRGHISSLTRLVSLGDEAGYTIVKYAIHFSPSLEMPCHLQNGP